MSTPPANTGDQQAPPRNRGWFQAGRSGNPAGRTPGSKNRINEDFLRELSDHFAKEGRSAIERMCDEDPAAYVKVVASLLPKDVKISAQPFAEFSDDELAHAIELIQQWIDAGQPQLGGGTTIQGDAVTLSLPTDCRS